MRLRIIKLRLTDWWFYVRRKAPAQISKWLLFGGFLGILLVIYDLGFLDTAHRGTAISAAYTFFATTFLFLYTLKMLLEIPFNMSQPVKTAEFIIICLFIILVDQHLLGGKIIQENQIAAKIIKSAGTMQLAIAGVFFFELSKSSILLLRVTINPSLIYAGSFFLLIVIGTGLLLLPKATNQEIGFIDALFTSTSAVCVTGLIVTDTATHFSRLGQGVILLLIQLGGLGVLIFTSFFGFFFQGSQSFKSQIMLKDFVNEERLGEIFSTLVKIVVFALAFELVGAAVIFYTLNHPDHMIADRIWYSVFHAVSAFCNAGFSVFTNGLADDAMHVRTNYNLHLIIAALIVIGGIGFPVVINFYQYVKYTLINFFNRLIRKANYHHVPRLINVNSRIVVVTSLILLVFGTLAFWLFEKDNSLQGLNVYQQAVTAFFGAVTPRTAGFNTIDMHTIALPTIMLYFFLMWVGASPSSTGGGIKTSTFALAFLNIIQVVKGRERLELFRREISQNSINRAFGIIVLSLFVIGLSAGLLHYFDSHMPIRAIIFESISAFSTVGLSLGITANLSQASKVVLICTMFIGRIGTLTLLVALVKRISSTRYRYPSEHILIN